MHKHYYSILSALTIFCSSLTGMEEQCPVYTFSGKAIPSYVTKPTCVAWLADNSIAIGGIGGLDFFDPVTQQSIAQAYKISNDPDDCVYDIATNNNQTQVATASFKHIMHYDSKEKKIVSKIPTNVSEQNCVGFLSDEFGFFSDELLYYNKQKIGSEPFFQHIVFPGKSTFSQYTITSGQLNKLDIFFLACHPYKDVILCSSYNENAYSTLTPHPIYSLVDDRFFSGNHLIGLSYNHNGSLLAINELNKIYLKKTDGNKKRLKSTKKNIYFSNTEKPVDIALYHSMAFNTHNMLAVLSWENSIQFWHCCNEDASANLVAILNLDQTQAIEHQNYSSKRLAFSPDETKIVVAFCNNSFIFPVPFEAFCTPQKRAFLLHSLFVLQNDAFEQIPSDIKQLIMKTLISTIHQEKKVKIS